MKVYKLTVCVVDREGIGVSSVEDMITNVRYANRCISPRVMEIEAREIEWDEGRHPLNNSVRAKAAFEELFGPASSSARRE